MGMDKRAGISKNQKRLPSLAILLEETENQLEQMRDLAPPIILDSFEEKSQKRKQTPMLH